VAREFATSKASMILWGMGISQHVHGTDNARCLIALATVTGQIGKPGSGLHPLRGQNNVQGASDAGLIPMMYPNYQRVNNPLAHDWFEKFWDSPLDSQPGYTVVEIMHKALAADTDSHKVRGMYIMGHERPRFEPCASRFGVFRPLGGSRYFHDRNRMVGRRGVACHRMARKNGYRDQHRSHGANGPTSG
jgi:formate dehydrogenase major subunit